MNPPKISICIPTYNGKEHLAECLTSIRRQTFSDWEALIYDDNSPDGTLDFARKLVGDDPRFHFIANPRRFGLVGNWNNCISHARGQWIKFVFQDDIIHPRCLEMLIGACERHNKLLGFCARDFIFDQGVSSECQEWFLKHRQGLHDEYVASPLIEPAQAMARVIRNPSHNPIGEPTVTLIHRRVFDLLGAFDEALIQLCDTEYWYRVMINYGAVFVPELLASFRIHHKATSSFNLSQRRFRMATLDDLVLRYRIAFDRNYHPLRASQACGKNALSLRLDCVRLAAQTYREAKSGGTDYMKEWNEIISIHRGLSWISKLGRGLNLVQRVKAKVGRIVRSKRAQPEGKL